MNEVQAAAERLRRHCECFDSQNTGEFRESPYYRDVRDFPGIDQAAIGADCDAVIDAYAEIARCLGVDKYHTGETRTAEEAERVLAIVSQMKD